MESIAHSISRPVRQRLRQGQSVARVLAIFEHACDLVTPDGEVIALVPPQIGDGPLNIVLDDPTDLFTGIDLSAPVTLAEEQLWVGGLQVDLREAIVWEPQPDWDTLRTRRAAIASHLPLLYSLGHHHAPSNTLLALLDPSLLRGPLLKGPLLDDKLTATIFSTAQKAGADLREGWAGDLKRLQEAGTGLAGLGGGLTPAGDDFLTGAMLWAWLAHPTPDPFCHTLLQVAVSRTTTLSAAFLRAAVRGECSASWHTLLASLSEGTEAEITAAVREVLAHGATSGADALAGFLYIPIMTTTSPLRLDFTSRNWHRVN
jgi:hypothetical protein